MQTSQTLSVTTDIVIARYKFTRSNSARGFVRPASVLNDADSLLRVWRAGDAARSFTVESEHSGEDGSPSFLVARLQTSAADVDLNRGVMDDYCKDHGLVRDVLPIQGN